MKKLLFVGLITLGCLTFTGCGDKYISYTKFVDTSKSVHDYFQPEQGDKIEFKGELAVSVNDGTMLISSVAEISSGKYPVSSLVYFDDTNLKLDTLSKIEMLKQDSDIFHRANVTIKGTYDSRPCLGDEEYYGCIVVDEITFN